MNRVPTHPLHTVDEFVEAYESAREISARDASTRGGEQVVSLLDYLPAAGVPIYHEVAAELIRIDMEYSWNKGSWSKGSWSKGKRKRLVDYQTLLPEVFRDQEVLGQVAYEEYRLRGQAGEKVSADQYHSQYGIPTDQWLRWNGSQSSGPENSSRDASSRSSIPELWQEALELAADVQDFPVVGDSFLDFSLERELGRGAFSHVFLARQGELAERLVVLKIASGNSLEPQHLARLQHTNIVPIYSVHRQEKLTAVCMPYFGQRTLADLLTVVRQEPRKIGSQQNLISTFLNRRDPTQLAATPWPRQASVGLPQQEPVDLPQQKIESEVQPHAKVLEVLAESNYVDAVIWLVKQMAEGLCHAHERGIVHRDLKPANVLLTDEGLPMLLDFNLSAEVVVHGRTSLLVGGTLPYMSPEQLEAVTVGGQVGTQADLFSLGVIFFELLTGARPFADRSGAFDDVVREMMADRQAGCPRVRGMNRAIPRSIEAVMCRCLAPNLQQRYSTAGELVEDLDRHLHFQPLRYAPDRSVTERTKKWLKRHPNVTSAGGVAAIASCALLLLFGLWILRGHRIARLEAEDTFRAFRGQQPALHMALGLPHTDTQVLRDSIASTRASLASYKVLDESTWRNRKEYQSLTSMDRSELNHRLAELLYLVARANERLIASEAETDGSGSLVNESLALNRLAVELFSAESCPQALLQQQARLLDHQGQPDAAKRIHQRTAAPASQNAIDQYAQVYDLLSARKYGEVEPLLSALRDRNPTDPLPWLLLGDAQVALHQLSESAGCFTTAVALEPRSYMAYFHRGLCRLELKQYVDAIADFEQVIALRPQLACGYLNRALALRLLGNNVENNVEAIADLTKALELGATETRIYFLRAELRRRAGDVAGAEADIKIGLERTPSDELSWVSRGVAKLKLDAEAALADFQQALRLNPASSIALHNCVHVYADRLNQQEEAFATVNQLLRLNEKDADALASRAVLNARAGNRQLVTVDIQQLLRQSKAPKSLFQAACALSLTSRPENSDAATALTLLSQAVQIDPMWFVRAHTDPDLESLRKTKAFQTYAANTRKISRLKMDLNKSLGEQ